MKFLLLKKYVSINEIILRILQYDIYFFNYQLKFKEIEFKSERFSRNFPNFVKPLSVKSWLLLKDKIWDANLSDHNYVNLQL